VQISHGDSNLWSDQNYGTEDGKRLSKRPKLEDHIKALEKVRASYADAKRDSKIQSSWMPKLESESEDQHIKKWDPYVLQKRHLNGALLKKDKLDNILRRVQLALKRVPTAEEWETQTKISQLLPADICDILRSTFGRPVSKKRQTTVPANIPLIFRLSVAFYQHADNLDNNKILNYRAALIARLIGFALMRVHEVASSASPSEVSTT